MQLDPHRNSAAPHRSTIYSVLFLSALIFLNRGNGDGGYAGSEFTIQPALRTEVQTKRTISPHRIQWKKEYERLGTHALSYYNAYMAVVSAHQSYLNAPMPELRVALRAAYRCFKEHEEKLFIHCSEKQPPVFSKLSRTLKSNIQSPRCVDFNFETFEQATNSRPFVERFGATARLALIAVSESGTVENEKVVAVNSLGMLQMPER